VLERSGLETRACECYAVVKKEWSRLLSVCGTATAFPLPSDSRRRPTGPPGAIVTEDLAR
jgi:hypothetical protein